MTGIIVFAFTFVLWGIATLHFCISTESPLSAKPEYIFQHDGCKVIETPVPQALLIWFK